MLKFVVLLCIASTSFAIFTDEDFDSVSLESRKLFHKHQDRLKDIVKKYKKEYKEMIPTFGKAKSKSWVEEFNGKFKTGIDQALTAARVCFHVYKEFEACNVGFQWGEDWDPRFKDVVIEQERERIDKFIQHTVERMQDRLGDL